MVRRLVVVIFSVIVSACAANKNIEPSHAMQQKTSHYAAFSRETFTPYFQRAGINYPSKKLVLLVLKHSKQLQVYAEKAKGWSFIRSFSITAASGGPGPKLRSGDYQVPEGIYKIEALNPDSHFDLSMHLNYPNRFDRVHARLDGRRYLGGDIFIHGGHRSVGCVALGNHAIQKLYALVDTIGLKNVMVVIAPNDLRTQKPLYTRNDPTWVPALYRNILSTMRQLPLPPA
jgi:murein L,D-transpeptidase YafK